MANHVGRAMDLGRACAVAGFADRRGGNSAERNLEPILLPAPHGPTGFGPNIGSRASDRRLALRAFRQRRRSRSRTGAFDTRAPGMDGDRSRSVPSRGSQRDCCAGALLRSARTVVASGGAKLSARFRIVRTRVAHYRHYFRRYMERTRRPVSTGCGARRGTPGAADRNPRWCIDSRRLERCDIRRFRLAPGGRIAGGDSRPESHANPGRAFHFARARRHRAAHLDPDRDERTVAAWCRSTQR